MPSDLRDELISVKVKEDTEAGVTLECVISKTVLFNMFGSYDFTREVERMVTRKIIDNLPREIIDKVLNNIDLNTVAKLTTIEMSKALSNRN